MAEARIGKVTSINYKKGMARVTYMDKDKNVTQELPFLAGEYNMPEIDSQVLVLHISNGYEMGVIIGTLWSNKNKPVDENDEEYGAEDVWRKDITKDKKTYMMYDPEKDELIIKAKTIRLDGNVQYNSVDGEDEEEEKDENNNENEKPNEEDDNTNNEIDKEDEEDKEELEEVA